MGLKAVPNAQMKERNGKLSLVFPEVDSIEQASELLSHLVPSPSKP
jgi:transcription-repair coupling factor (superfamily II helicase)